jgi:predicted transposase YbfD/YdcC
MGIVPAGSLLRVLQQIPDPRGRQGRRHSLSAMLATVVCAMLCGCRGYSAIAEWIHNHPSEVWHWLGFTRKPPKLGAFRKLLMRLPPQDLEAALAPWVDQLLGDIEGDGKRLQAIAMDGKSLCGTLSEHGRALHLLSLLEQHTGFTLRQLEVPGKTNEHKAALALLKTIVLEGRVVTGDAMFCQRDLCEQIVEDGGHYFFEVKDNQPELKKSIQAEFEPAFSPLHGEAAASRFVRHGNAQQRARASRMAVPGSLHPVGRPS